MILFVYHFVVLFVYHFVDVPVVGVSQTSDGQSACIVRFKDLVREKSKADKTAFGSAPARISFEPTSGAHR